MAQQVTDILVKSGLSPSLSELLTSALKAVVHEKNEATSDMSGDLVSVRQELARVTTANDKKRRAITDLQNQLAKQKKKLADIRSFIDIPATTGGNETESDSDSESDEEEKEEQEQPAPVFVTPHPQSPAPTTLDCDQYLPFLLKDENGWAGGVDHMVGNEAYLTIPGLLRIIKYWFNLQKTSTLRSCVGQSEQYYKSVTRAMITCDCFTRTRMMLVDKKMIVGTPVLRFLEGGNSCQISSPVNGFKRFLTKMTNQRLHEIAERPSVACKKTN